MVLCTAAALAGGGYEITRYTIDGGGGESSGGSYGVAGTIGQADASTAALAGGGYALRGGFWLAAADVGASCATVADCIDPCDRCIGSVCTPVVQDFADTNLNGGNPTVDDLLCMLDTLGDIASSACLPGAATLDEQRSKCNIVGATPQICAPDPSVNVNDLLALLDALGGTFSCRSCPPGGPRCGNGILQTPQEQCDDGNTTSGDGCDATCQTE